MAPHLWLYQLLLAALVLLCLISYRYRRLHVGERA